MTTPVTETDVDLKSFLLQHLKLGEENAIKGKQLASMLGVKSTRQIRLAMVELRHELKPIIGGQKGYFIAKNIDEIQKARKYLLSYVKDLCIDLRDYKYIIRKYTGQLKMDLK